MANITQEIALLERQKKSAKTNRDKVDIMRKVKQLKEELTKQQTQTALPAARKVVKQMPNESFKEFIARLKLKPEYAFLKNMGLGKIADDYRVVGKRVGWRVKGHHNYKVPSKKFRKDNPDLVYYEDRKNRSDVYRPDRLEQGGEVGDNNSTIFDSLKKGDKINITYSSGISRTNEKKLQLRSKNIVGKGKSYESEKITFDNLDNPTGVKYYAYKRKDDSVGFAMGDMAISHVVITKGGMMAKGGAVKKSTFVLTNEKGEEIFRTTSLNKASDRRVMQPNKDNIKIDVIEPDGSSRNLMAKGGKLSDNYTDYKHFDLNSEGNFASKKNGKNYEIIYRDDKSKLYDLFENGKKIKSDKSVRDVMYFAEGGSVKKKRFEDGGEVKTGVEIMAAPKGHPEVEGNFLFPSNANKNTLGIKLAKGGVSGEVKVGGYKVDFFHTAANVYANITIPSENPTFEDDKQIKGVGKTEKEALRDLEKNIKQHKYAKGGNLKYYDKETEYRLGRPSGSIEKEILEKVKYYTSSDELFMGNFGWITPNKKSAEGYLYKSDGFDTILKDVKLKAGERIFIYLNSTTAIGGMTPLIKINLDKELLYFLADSDNDEIVFETKGVPARYIALIEHKMAKGGVVVTSIKDIPNFQQRLDEGKITYRGLGLGKLWDDFYKVAGTSGTRIKVDSKEYFITDEEFDTFSRGADGKLRIRFDAPKRRLERGGKTNEKGEFFAFDDDDDDFSAYYWKETQDKNGKITGYDVIEKDSHQTVYQNRSKQKALEFIDRYKSGYAKGGEVAAIEVGDWVSEKKGTARGKVYEDTGSFIKLEDKYGGKSNTLYSKRQFKKSVKPRY